MRAVGWNSQITQPKQFTRMFPFINHLCDYHTATTIWTMKKVNCHFTTPPLFAYDTEPSWPCDLLHDPEFCTVILQLPTVASSTLCVLPVGWFIRTAAATKSTLSSKNWKHYDKKLAVTRWGVAMILEYVHLSFGVWNVGSSLDIWWQSESRVEDHCNGGIKLSCFA